MIRFFIVIFCSTASAATIYKSEDEFGRPVFSNRADETASEVELKEPTTYKAEKVVVPKISQKETQSQQRYRTLTIVEPENDASIRDNDASIRDNAGTLTLTVKVEPRILSHHTLTLLMDGEHYQKLTESGTTILQNVDRGTHLLQLQVTPEQSGEIIETGPAHPPSPYSGTQYSTKLPIRTILVHILQICSTIQLCIAH